MKWREGPDMIDSIVNATVVQDERSFFLVGGEDPFHKPVQTLYAYDHDLEKWTLLKQRLRVPRTRAVAMRVPDTVLPI